MPGLRRLFPGAELHWVANTEYVPLVSAAGLDRAIPFERGAWRTWSGAWDGARQFARLCAQMRRGRYGIVIDLQGLARSAVMTAVTGAPLRVGYADAREGARLVYNRRIEVDRAHTHAVDCCLAALRSLGMEKPAAAWEWTALGHHRASVRARLGLEPRGYCIVAPAARWHTKEWLPDRFASVAASLASGHGLKVLLTGDQGQAGALDALRAKTISAGCPETMVAACAGTLSLVELLAACADARIVVTLDTGTMHLAASVQTPTVALMGPTNPVRHGPYGQLNRVVRPSECDPCYKRRCPKGRNCMADITVEQVMTAIGDVLEA
ncbi:glycosyltransferase family 9 protein [bacterium]|nr:glycosyltransferase family 9 protein [bacterium]